MLYRCLRARSGFPTWQGRLESALAKRDGQLKALALFSCLVDAQYPIRERLIRRELEEV